MLLLRMEEVTEPVDRCRSFYNSDPAVSICVGVRSQRVTTGRAVILLKADMDGPGWKDEKISEAVGCRIRTVENVRREFVLEGLEAALVRKKRTTSPTPKLLDGAAEAKLIALRLGKPPAGYGHWTLRLLADRLVELEIVESISPETVRQTLKKTA